MGLMCDTRRHGRPPVPLRSARVSHDIVLVPPFSRAGETRDEVVRRGLGRGRDEVGTSWDEVAIDAIAWVAGTRSGTRSGIFGRDEVGDDVGRGRVIGLAVVADALDEFCAACPV
jgi:hypothetical protein